MVARGSVGRPRPRAGGFKAVSRAVVGEMRGHAGAWMFFGLVRRCLSKVFAAKKLTALAHRLPNLY